MGREPADVDCGTGDAADAAADDYQGGDRGGPGYHEADAGLKRQIVLMGTAEARKDRPSEKTLAKGPERAPQSVEKAQLQLGFFL